MDARTDSGSRVAGTRRRVTLLALCLTLGFGAPLGGCTGGEPAESTQVGSLQIEGTLLHEERVGDVYVAFYETPSGLMSLRQSPMDGTEQAERIAESLRQPTLTESFSAFRETVNGAREVPKALQEAQKRHPFVPVAYDETALKATPGDFTGAAQLEVPLQNVRSNPTDTNGKLGTLSQGLTQAEDDAWVRTWLCFSTQTCQIGFGYVYSGWIQNKSSYRVHLFNSSNDTAASYGSRYRISSRQNWVIGMSGMLQPRYQVEATYYATVGNIARDSWISGWQPFPITPTSNSVTFDQTKPIGRSMRVNMAQSWAEPSLKAFVGGSQQLHGFCVNQDVASAFNALPYKPSGKVRYGSAGGEQLRPFNHTLFPFGECWSFSAAWDNHIQGVGRLRTTNNDNRWFVMSRSRPGHVGGAGIFLAQFADVAGNPEGRLVAPGADYSGEPPSYPGRRTWYYYPIPDTDHPGGFQVVGGLLAIANEGAGSAAGFVDFYDLRVPGADNAWFQRFTLDGTHGEPTGNYNTKPSGAGLVKLSNGLYLLFVLNKDDQYSGEFYLSNTSTLSTSTWWQWLSRATWNGRKYQNANFINDCNGNLYLGMTNNEGLNAECGWDGCSVFSGQNTADVFSVAFQPGTFNIKLSLAAQRVFGPDDGGYNQFRAAANFHVARDNKLLLYSHSHHANTDVIGCPDSKLKLSEFAY